MRLPSSHRLAAMLGSVVTSVTHSIFFKSLLPAMKKPDSDPNHIELHHCRFFGKLNLNHCSEVFVQCEIGQSEQNNKKKKKKCTGLLLWKMHAKDRAPPKTLPASYHPSHLKLGSTMEKWQVYGIFLTTAIPLRWKELYLALTNFQLQEKVSGWETVPARTLAYNPKLKGWSPGRTTELTAQTEQGTAVHKEHHSLSTGNLSAVHDYQVLFICYCKAPYQLKSLIFFRS